ncbi:MULTISPECIES: hypothetical protein [Streptomyces]|uniref:hypothetical protein n=1 Tax=Streptomyces TaxID=1883 RepID=UPI001318C365|nr:MULTISPECIES: hypothetical protein [Streptomyces]QGZ48345.1 hypothetical protein GPZ77_08075 [Streptomyces sp. QHH-9511]GGT65973.1 hypothetical protein GCM10010272_05620 [Streptomyces lateritius]
MTPLARDEVQAIGTRHGVVLPFGPDFGYAGEASRASRGGRPAGGLPAPSGGPGHRPP